MKSIFIIVLTASAYGYTGYGHPQNPDYRRAFVEQRSCERFIRRYPTAIRRGFPLPVIRIECERVALR